MQIESHSVSSLSLRVLLSRKTVAAMLSDGRIKPLNTNTAGGRSYAFTSDYLDLIRQARLAQFSVAIARLTPDERQQLTYVHLSTKQVEREIAEECKLAGSPAPSVL